MDVDEHRPLPAKRAGGVLSRPEISRPSKLFQRTIDCLPNAAVSTPGGAYGVVQRCTAPFGGSTTAIVLGAALLS